jgi:hypothetical protein
MTAEEARLDIQKTTFKIIFNKKNNIMPVVYTGAIKLRGAQIAEIGLEQLYADKSIADGL